MYRENSVKTLVCQKEATPQWDIKCFCKQTWKYSKNRGNSYPEAKLRTTLQLITPTLIKANWAETYNLYQWWTEGQSHQSNQRWAYGHLRATRESEHKAVYMPKLLQNVPVQISFSYCNFLIIDKNEATNEIFLTCQFGIWCCYEMLYPC